MDFIDETNKMITFSAIKIGQGFEYNDFTYIKINSTYAFRIADNEIKTVNENLKVYPRKIVVHIY